MCAAAVMLVYRVPGALEVVVAALVLPFFLGIPKVLYLRYSLGYNLFIIR